MRLSQRIPHFIIMLLTYNASDLWHARNSQRFFQFSVEQFGVKFALCLPISIGLDGVWTVIMLAEFGWCWHSYV